MSATRAADCARRLAAEVLQSNGLLQLRVTGSSMLPSLWPGDVLTIESETSKSVSVGEIILFQRGDQFVIHRVARVSSSGGQAQLTTRGDSMVDDDTPILFSEVLGRVTWVQRGREPVSVPARLSFFLRSFGWIFSRSGFLTNIALRCNEVRRRQTGFNSTISEGAR